MYCCNLPIFLGQMVTQYLYLLHNVTSLYMLKDNQSQVESPCAGGFGDWSTRGCTLVNETEEEAMCECDHLTNFAILLVCYKTPYHKQGNTTLSLPPPPPGCGTKKGGNRQHTSSPQKDSGGILLYWSCGVHFLPHPHNPHIHPLKVTHEILLSLSPD